MFDSLMDFIKFNAEEFDTIFPDFDEIFDI